jgi:hypothetical protein
LELDLCLQFRLFINEVFDLLDKDVLVVDPMPVFFELSSKDIFVLGELLDS